MSNKQKIKGLFHFRIIFIFFLFIILFFTIFFHLKVNYRVGLESWRCSWPKKLVNYIVQTHVMLLGCS